MKSNKSVIQITKKSNDKNNSNSYYFVSVVVLDGRTNIQTTTNVWDATMFNYLSSNEASTWCSFIRVHLGNDYEVNIKSISLEY